MAATAGHDSLIASIGNFDGVHFGHRTLLGLTVTRATELSLPSLAVTFQPYPIEILKKIDIKHLCGFEKKVELLAATGLNLLYVLPFTRELAALDARSFILKYLQPLGVKEMFVGFNFRMGNDCADSESLIAMDQEQGIHVHSIEAVLHHALPISSTRIRTALTDGDLPLANAMLGRPYSVRGEIIHGHCRGGPLLGMPTANIAPGNQLMPFSATYATETRFPNRPDNPDQHWPSLTNFGRNPTFGENSLSLETHLLDFCGDIYGQVIEINFLHILRQERKFSSPEELKEQLNEDVVQRRELLI